MPKKKTRNLRLSAGIPDRFRYLVVANASLLAVFIGISLLQHLSASVGYPDVSKDHPYYSAILDVQAKGVMTGYGNGNFGPDDTLKRSELATILVRVHASKAEIDGCTDTPFPDVKAGNWYTNYVCAAKAKGYIAGYPDGTFRPGVTINVAEVSKIIAIAFHLPLTTEAPNAEQWYMPYVNALAAAGALPDTLHSASQQETRGEVAYTLSALLAIQSEHGAAPAQNSGESTSKTDLSQALAEEQAKMWQALQNAQNQQPTGLRFSRASSQTSNGTGLPSGAGNESQQTQQGSSAQTANSSHASSAQGAQSSAGVTSSASSTGGQQQQSSTFPTVTHSQYASCTVSGVTATTVGTEHLLASALDTDAGFGYVGSGPYVKKFNLSTVAVVSSLLVAQSGEVIDTAAVDASTHRGYFATTRFDNSQTDSRLILVDLNTFTVLNTLALSGKKRVMRVAVDSARGYAYVLAYDSTNGQTLLRINLSTFTQDGEYIPRVHISNDVTRMLTLDTVNNIAYIGDMDLFKVRLSNMTEMAFMPYIRQAASFRSFLFDTVQNIAYIGSLGITDASIFKTNLTSMSVTGEWSLTAGTQSGEIFGYQPTWFGALSGDRQTGYFSSGWGEFIAVNLTNMNQKISKLNFKSSNGVLSVNIDTIRNAIFFTTSDGGMMSGAIPAQIIRIPLNWNCQP